MISNLANLVARRDLLRELVSADLRVSTAGTRLGWIWWVLDPLLMMLIYSTIVVGLLGVGKARYAPYWLFIFIALITWKQFATTLSKASTVLSRKKGIIRAIPFPTMLLPIAQAVISFAHFLFGFALIAIGALLTRLPEHSGSFVPLLQLPILFCLQAIIVLALALPISSLGAKYRDIGSLMPHVTRVGFYLSPGLYGVDMVQETALSKLGPSLGQAAVQLYLLNPFALLIDGYRRCVLHGEFLPSSYWVTLVVEAVLLLAIGYRHFQRNDRAIIKLL